MDYLRGYRVFREDPEWGNKLLVGTLLFFSTAFIPILGQLVLTGWQALILRRAVAGETTPLPRLDFDFQHMGRLVGIGFKGFIARLIWSLPLVFLFGLLFGCLYLGLILAVVGAEGSGSAELVPIAMIACLVIGAFVLMPLLVLLSIPANVAAMRAELTDDLNQGMRFGEVIAFTRRHLGVLFKGTLVLWIVGSCLGVLGLLACYVGAFAVAVVGMAANAHFHAQVYRLHVESGGEPLPLASGADPLPPTAPVGGAGLGPGPRVA